MRFDSIADLELLLGVFKALNFSTPFIVSKDNLSKHDIVKHIHCYRAKIVNMNKNEVDIFITEGHELKLVIDLHRDL